MIYVIKAEFCTVGSGHKQLGLSVPRSCIYSLVLFHLREVTTIHLDVEITSPANANMRLG